MAPAEHTAVAVLRQIALRYARHGWPVLPGSFRMWPGGVNSGQPVVPKYVDGPPIASLNRVQIARWWSCIPYPVLVATGDVFDVLEVSEAVAFRAIRLLDRKGIHTPVLRLPGGLVRFLVSPDTTAHFAFAHVNAIRVLAFGSWTPVPPLALAGGQLRWLVSPDETEWTVADSWKVRLALRLHTDE